VPAAQGILRKTDPAVARSSLVFPTSAMAAKARDYPTYRTRSEYDTWNGIFDPIMKV
jgi:hypothetical protein